MGLDVVVYFAVKNPKASLLAYRPETDREQLQVEGEVLSWHSGFRWPQEEEDFEELELLLADARQIAAQLGCDRVLCLTDAEPPPSARRLEAEALPLTLDAAELFPGEVQEEPVAPPTRRATNSRGPDAKVISLSEWKARR